MGGHSRVLVGSRLGLPREPARMARRLVLKGRRPLPAAVVRTHAGVVGLPVVGSRRADAGDVPVGELILRRRTMALTGRTDTETSGSHMTLGREALDDQGPVDYDQGPVDYDQGPVTGDRVREQEAPEEAEEQAGSSPSAVEPADPAEPAVAGAGGPSRRPVTVPQ